jgi:acyl transferase domain-containing protein
MVNSHSEITAFFASLSKVLSIMETGLIPPNVNLKTKNPAIKWDEYHVKVVERITRLPKASEPLVAMTSSGIGGANGHAVIEGPPPFHSITAAESFWRPGAKERADLLVLGGLSPRSTTSIAQVAQSLIGSSHLRDATLTYGRVSRSMTWRSWGIARRDQKTDFSEPILASRSKRPIVFVFSGQGSQHFESEMTFHFALLPWLKSAPQWDEAFTELVVCFKKPLKPWMRSTCGKQASRL